MCRTVKKGDRLFNPESNKDAFLQILLFCFRLQGGWANRILECYWIIHFRCLWCQCFRFPATSDRSACVHVFPSVIVSVKGRHRQSCLMSSGLQPRASLGGNHQQRPPLDWAFGERERLHLHKSKIHQGSVLALSVCSLCGGIFLPFSWLCSYFEVVCLICLILAWLWKKTVKSPYCPSLHAG